MHALSRVFPGYRVARVALCCAIVAVARAVTLGPLFTDGAVLQCDKPIAVWGTAEPGEKVSVAFAAEEADALTGADGRWIVFLPALPASAVGADLVVTGKEGALTIHDVLVGDVWLCSGQSNMEFTVGQALNAEREIAAANFPLIRHVRIERQVSATPETHVPTSGWLPATPANVAKFTAVGYFFAREIHQRFGLPIGIVHSSVGGTPIEAWMSPFAFSFDPGAPPFLQQWQTQAANYPAARAEYERQFAVWSTAQSAAQTRGEKAYVAWLRANPRPSLPHGAPNDPWTPTGLFNGMINPLLPFGLRGVLWYQGESNTDRSVAYQATFSALIIAWRAHFGQGDIPFYWVNLPGLHANDPSDMAWAFLREAQTKTLSLPNTGQAVAIDLGEPYNIHPRNKQEVARRLALLAKHRVYGMMADDAGPTFTSATREGSAMRLRFSGASTGIVAHDRPPQALEVAGPDRVFCPAFGKIERNTLLVWSPQVKDPVAVRYAWHDAPDANLYGGAGLPVVPFRSDSW